MGVQGRFFKGCDVSLPHLPYGDHPARDCSPRTEVGALLRIVCIFYSIRRDGSPNQRESAPRRWDSFKREAGRCGAGPQCPGASFLEKKWKGEIRRQLVLHYRSIQNRFLKRQFGFKIPLNSINRQVQDRQFTDYPLSEILTPPWRAESEATWQLISPILIIRPDIIPWNKIYPQTLSLSKPATRT